ncbi:hypothetical protein IJD34_01740 [bacterium]|nr:hypothetical protein [bacterium]
MSFEIDISKLKGDWKKWAEAADSYDYGTKDGKINSAFEEYYIMIKANDAKKSEAEVAEIFGAEFAKKYANEITKTNTNLKETKDPSRKDAKLMKDDILSSLESSKVAFAANPNWEEFAKNLKTEFLEKRNGLIDKQYYNQLLVAVDEVANVMKDFKYESRNDVIKLYKQVKDKLDLKRNDKLKDFKLDVLEEFVKLADDHQKSIEFTKLQNKYKELIESGKSRTEAVAELNSAKEFQGSYYQNYWGPDGKQSIEKDAMTYYNQGLISLLEKTDVRADARNDYWSAMAAQREENPDENTPTTGKAIKKAAKQEMKKDGDYDKYAQKVVRTGDRTVTQLVNFEASPAMAYANAIGIENNVNLRKKEEYTLKDLKSAVKDDSVLPKLIGTLISKNENTNTYNISKLSDVIEKYIGANNTAHLDDEIPYSEVHNIAEEFSRISNTEISKEDAIKLIEFAGYKFVGRNLPKIAWNSTFGNLFNYIAPLLSSQFAFSESFRPMINVFGNEEIDLTLNINGADVKVNRKNILDQLQEQGYDIFSDDVYVGFTEDGFKIYAKKPYSESGVTNSDITVADAISDRAGVIALKTVLITTVLNFVYNAFSMVEHEFSIDVTQFDVNDLDTYNERVDSQRGMNAEQKAALKELAKMFQNTITNEDGTTTTTWDSVGFKNLLDKIAGSESKLSSHEFAIGCFNTLQEKQKEISKKLEKTPEENTPPPPPAKPKETPKPQNKYGTEHIPGYQDCPEANYHNGNKHTWQGIAAMYAGSEHSYKEIVRAIKYINGIKLSDNVIPKDLYLPDKLFEDDKITRKDLSESEIKAADVAVIKNTGEIRSNGTKIKCTTVDGRYKGVATKPDGTVIRTPEDYATEEEALDAIKKQLEEK